MRLNDGHGGRLWGKWYSDGYQMVVGKGVCWSIWDVGLVDC